MSDLAVRITSHLQGVYHFNGEYPRPKYLMESFEIDEFALKEIINSVNKVLPTRGLPEYTFEIDPKKANELDPFFVMAVDLVLDFHDKRSIAVKLKDVGLTTKQWKAFLRRKTHKEYFAKRMDMEWGDVDSIAKMSLMKAAESGDLQSIKYALELNGTYRPNQELLLNVGVIIGKLMEVLTRYLPPDQLRLVADDFDSVLNSTGREIESAK